jgi:hypothetical protein
MGDAAQGLFTLPQLEHMQDRIELNISDVRMLDKDMRITATIDK